MRDTELAENVLSLDYAIEQCEVCMQTALTVSDQKTPIAD